MKAAFSVWHNRIAPVFDVARSVQLVEVTGDVLVCDRCLTSMDEMPVRKALQLAELQVDTLVCGAISKPVLQIVSAYDIQVISFVAGDLDEVIAAWQAGLLESDLYAMPGCCRRKGAPPNEQHCRRKTRQSLPRTNPTLTRFHR